MGFFSDLGALVSDVKQVAEEVTTTVNDTKQTVADTAEQLTTEVTNVKDGIVGVGQELHSTVNEQVNTIKETIDPR